ncbi:MAG: excinuclease ABC subunit UvrA [Bdellovibrio sp.]
MQSHKFLNIQKAKTHNLKNLDLKIPLNKLIVVKGPSGSGKSSLVFHTIYAESKRRLINSLPTDVKFFWDIPNRSDVEDIFPVFPVWGLMQNNPIVGSRPSVSDLLGLTEKFQNLFFYFGENVCPVHKKALIDNKWNSTMKFFSEAKGRIHLFCSKVTYLKITKILPTRVYSNKSIVPFYDEAELWEIGRFKNSEFEKCRMELEGIFQSGGQEDEILLVDSAYEQQFVPIKMSEGLKCPNCDFSLSKKLSYEMLSPFNAYGACQECSGHGYKLKFSRLKIVKNPTLSINDGAINLLNSSHFSYAKKDFLKEVKRMGYNLDKPFQEIEDLDLWNFIENGNSKFEGTHKLFSYLDPYRYKRSVRIFLRSYQEEELCDACLGTRLSPKTEAISIGKKNKINLRSLYLKRISEVLNTFENLKDAGHDSLRLIRELLSTLRWAEKLGLGYLNLKKKAKSLSISEYQRLLLVKYLSYNGTQAVFVLDEPTIGLSYKEQIVLAEGLRSLVDEGNTVIVVDHSDIIEKKSDHLILMGPGAGVHGGEIVYQGKVKNSEKKINLKKPSVSSISTESIVCRKFTIAEDQKIDIELKLGAIHFVSGDSGVGKSNLFLNQIANSIQFKIYGESDFDERPINTIKIPQSVRDCFIFDTKISRYSSRSTVGSYLDLSPYLRKYFAGLDYSKSLNLKDGHFSPNSELGQCDFCQGSGINNISMQFIEDIQLTCEVCKGRKIKYHLSNISDGKFKLWQYYQMTIDELFEHVPLTPKGKRILDLLKRFNLSHLTLERQLSTLSGGEVLRVKLISQLIKKDIKNAILFFESVSFGLSTLELKILAEYFYELLDSENTIVVLDNHPIFKKISNFDHSFERNQDLSVSYQFEKIAD